MNSIVNWKLTADFIPENPKIGRAKTLKYGRRDVAFHYALLDSYGIHFPWDFDKFMIFNNSTRLYSTHT